MLKNFNFSNILLVENDSLICVSVNPIMSIFIILLPLTISCTYLGSYLTLQTSVTASPEIAFIFIVENKSFYFRRSYSSNASLSFPQIFQIPLYNENHHHLLPYLVQYAFVMAQIIFPFVDQN